MLDQFLVSKGLLTGKSGFEVQVEATAVVMDPEMVKAGPYPQPLRHGRPSSQASFNPDGFSDHYPITTVLRSA